MCRLNHFTEFQAKRTAHAALAVALLLVAGCGNQGLLEDPEMARARRLCDLFMDADAVEVAVGTAELSFEQGFTEAELVDEMLLVCRMTMPRHMLDECTSCTIAIVQAPAPAPRQ